MSISTKSKPVPWKGSFAKQQAYLSALLGMERQPVGIHFYDDQLDYDMCPARQPTVGLPYCTAVAKATQGHCYKLDAAHCRCQAASVALGFLPATEERRSGKLYAKKGVYRDLDVAHKVATEMTYCQKSHVGVGITPLELCTHTPEVVLVICPPKSAMRLLQGYAYHYGQLKNIRMSGMCGICQECTSYPLEKNKLNISILCSGTRCVGRWHPQEMGVGFPYNQLATIIDGIWQTTDLMEPDKEKTDILQRFSSLGLESPQITWNHNYYSDSYGRPY